MKKAKHLSMDWVNSAHNDIKLVQRELNFIDEEILIGIICFHCQQATEKLLKAFLIFHQVDFPKTHNLELLLELCSRLDEDFKSIDVEGLTEYAVNVRYPDNFQIPSLDDAKEAFDKTKQVDLFIQKKLKFE